MPGYQGNWCNETYSTEGSSKKMSCVPLPWWTSKSTIATLPCGASVAAWAAPTATWLSRQNPMARVRVAWWPGGRTRQTAVCPLAKASPAALQAAPDARRAISKDSSPA